MTPRPTPRAASLPVAVLRDAVAHELATISLRRAAAEVGLSPNGLKNFVAGAAPRRTTRARLEAWLASRRPKRGGPQLGSLVRRLGEIGADLPAGDRAALGQSVAGFLLRAYRERQLPAPRWVRELASHYRARPAAED